MATVWLVGLYDFGVGRIGAKLVSCEKSAERDFARGFMTDGAVLAMACDEAITMPEVAEVLSVGGSLAAHPKVRRLYCAEPSLVPQGVHVESYGPTHDA